MREHRTIFNYNLVEDGDHQLLECSRCSVGDYSSLTRLQDGAYVKYTAEEFAVQFLVVVLV